MPKRAAVATTILLAMTLGGLEVARRATAARPARVRTAGAAPPASFYRVVWEGIEMPSRRPAGSTVRALVSFRNAGDGLWPDPLLAGPEKAGAGAVRLAYRWWRRDADSILTRYDVRTDLPWPLRPGESLTLPMEVLLPQEPGDYRLQIELVHEHVAWFGQRGAGPLWVPVSVGPAG